MPTKYDLTWYKEERFLSRQPPEELIRRGKKGDEHSREVLWKQLQPFVRSTVYLQIGNGEPEMYEDLVNAGNRGLLEAYARFNVEKGIKFTTYAYMFVWKAIDVEKWVIRGLNDDLARYASAVVKAKIALEDSGKENPDASEIAKSSGVAFDKVDKIVSFLNTTFVRVEMESDDGSPYGWLSKDDVQAEIEDEAGTIQRVWEFREEEIGFISPMIESYLLDRWGKDDPERKERFAESVRSPDRVYRRRLVFANGARGMIDISAFEEINKYSIGAGVYDRRRAWKELSLY